MRTQTPWSGRSLHFVAIGGAGMSGLALVAQELGARVTGTDRADSSYLRRVRAAGIDARVGHDPDAVPAGAEVVVSTAVPEDNPELLLARERGQRLIHRGELLAEVCALGRLIAVAGTHGKTTTAAMIAFALRRSGHDVPFLLGGELTGAGPDGSAANSAWGESEWIVAEADESDASFLELQPDVAVVTNLELDHHSRWSSRGELADAFERFLAPAGGVALGPDVELGAPQGARLIRYASDPALEPPALAVPGEHNRLNARACLGAIGLAGLAGAEATAALSDFPGVVRRLEQKGEREGVTVFDDYAHHPTEVRAALAAARELGAARLVAVFQPHLYSRTKALSEDFGAALAEADAIGVLDVYPAREEPVGALAGVSGLDVARAAAHRAGGRPVWWLRDVETAPTVLRDRLRPGDLLLTLGAGDVHRIGESLLDGGEAE